MIKPVDRRSFTPPSSCLNSANPLKQPVKKNRYSDGKLKAHYIGFLLCFAFGDISLSLHWPGSLMRHVTRESPSKCACKVHKRKMSRIPAWSICTSDPINQHLWRSNRNQGNGIGRSRFNSPSLLGERMQHYWSPWPWNDVNKSAATLEEL